LAPKLLNSHNFQLSPKMKELNTNTSHGQIVPLIFQKLTPHTIDYYRGDQNKEVLINKAGKELVK